MLNLSNDTLVAQILHLSYMHNIMSVNILQITLHAIICPISYNNDGCPSTICACTCEVYTVEVR